MGVDCAMVVIIIEAEDVPGCDMLWLILYGWWRCDLKADADGGDKDAYLVLLLL